MFSKICSKNRILDIIDKCKANKMCVIIVIQRDRILIICSDWYIIGCLKTKTFLKLFSVGFCRRYQAHCGTSIYKEV